MRGVGFVAIACHRCPFPTSILHQSGRTDSPMQLTFPSITIPTPTHNPSTAFFVTFPTNFRFSIIFLLFFSYTPYIAILFSSFLLSISYFFVRRFLHTVCPQRDHPHCRIVRNFRKTIETHSKVVENCKTEKQPNRKDSRTERQPNETKGPHGDCHTTLGCVTADCDYLRLAVAVIRGIAALLDQRRHEITIGRVFFRRGTSVW